MPRINIELLEPRRLLSAHGIEQPALLPPDFVADHGHVEAAFHDSQNGESRVDSDGPFQPSEIAMGPMVFASGQEGPAAQGFQITVIETVIDAPMVPQNLTGASTSQPALLRPDAQQAASTTTSDSNASNPELPLSGAPGAIIQTGRDEKVEIAVITDDGSKATFQTFLVRAGERVAIEFAGTGSVGSGREFPPTLLPADTTPIQRAQQVAPATTVAPTPMGPAVPIQIAPASVAASPPAAPPVLTPLAMTPGTPQGLSTTTASPTAAPAVVTITAPHQTVTPVGSAASETSQDAGHLTGYSLAAISSVAPALVTAQQLENYASGAVQIATGVIQPTAAIIEKAGQLIADPLPQASLPTAVAYNFIRFDAAVFHDAAALFAADLASMSGTTAVGTHSNTRAWVVTGVVLGCDAVFLGYWYRKNKREKKAAAYAV